MTPRFKVSLAASLLLLVASAQWFIFEAYIAPRQEAADDLVRLADVLRLENEKVPPKAAEDRGASITDLLALVQELAARIGVAVQAMEPVPGGDGEQFKLTIESDYGNLLRFLATFETLQVSITGFDVAPAMARPDVLAVSVNFTHTATPGIASPERAKTFEARLRTQILRDPFNPAGAPAALLLPSDGNDLTWTLHLTSISEIGTRRFATIDGRDYSIGDELLGLVVSEIVDDMVTLRGSEAEEKREFLLRFRTPMLGRI